MSLPPGAEELGTCVHEETVYFLPASGPQGPGHVYSAAGRREFALSGYCEFHFDLHFEGT